MSHVTHHSHVSQCLLYINSVHRLYNITALDQLPLSSQVVHSTQQVSWSSSSSTYIGIASTILDSISNDDIERGKKDGRGSAQSGGKMPVVSWMAMKTMMTTTMTEDKGEGCGDTGIVELQFISVRWIPAGT